MEKIQALPSKGDINRERETGWAHGAGRHDDAEQESQKNKSFKKKLRW